MRRTKVSANKKTPPKKIEKLERELKNGEESDVLRRLKKHLEENRLHREKNPPS